MESCQSGLMCRSRKAMRWKPPAVRIRHFPPNNYNLNKEKILFSTCGYGEIGKRARRNSQFMSICNSQMWTLKRLLLIPSKHAFCGSPDVNLARQRHLNYNSYADMAKLANALDSGSSEKSCRFKSCYPHHKTHSLKLNQDLNQGSSCRARPRCCAPGFG